MRGNLLGFSKIISVLLAVSKARKLAFCEWWYNKQFFASLDRNLQILFLLRYIFYSFCRREDRYHYWYRWNSILLLSPVMNMYLTYTELSSSSTIAFHKHHYTNFNRHCKIIAFWFTWIHVSSINKLHFYISYTQYAWVHLALHKTLSLMMKRHYVKPVF